MTTPTLTRATLVDALVRELGLPRHKATNFLEATLETMIVTIVEGENIKVSSFGSFNVRQKAKRLGRNPKTKKEAVITPRRVLSFKPSQYLKEKIQRKKS